jgi:hypothetical protein
MFLPFAITKSRGPAIAGDQFGRGDRDELFLLLTSLLAPGTEPNFILGWGSASIINHPFLITATLIELQAFDTDLIHVWNDHLYC